ncbi:O-methyltransferase [Paenibacillaceae bacterium T2]|uniref:O-methyltransferase n=1 Tax=Ferviditalea candida TaxID=3108399 RepID=A0ABU5ZCN5_9BACL|nr:O-methyltransferase [Paenibacillaceae bacterium T2]
MPQSAEEYVQSLYPEDADLQMVMKGIEASAMPQISIEPVYGRLLTMLTAIAGAKRALEIGALGGYSGICIARGLREGGKLISLELKQEFAEVAKRHMQKAGFGELVEYRIGEALDQLQLLEEEGQRFDLVFIDADKGNYPRYLEWAIRLANPGAVIIGDNAMLHGKTMDPGRNSPSAIAMRKFNKQIAGDPRLESTILPAYDGLAIARVK